MTTAAETLRQMIRDDNDRQLRVRHHRQRIAVVLIAAIAFLLIRVMGY